MDSPLPDKPTPSLSSAPHAAWKTAEDALKVKQENPQSEPSGHSQAHISITEDILHHIDSDHCT